MEKEHLAMVFSSAKFWPYLTSSKVIVFTNHIAMQNFLNKKKNIYQTEVNQVVSSIARLWYE